MGLVRSFQISAVFPHLTVLENVRIGLQRAQGTSYHFWRAGRSLDALNPRALQLLETLRRTLRRGDHVAPAPVHPADQRAHEQQVRLCTEQRRRKDLQQGRMVAS